MSRADAQSFKSLNRVSESRRVSLTLCPWGAQETYYELWLTNGSSRMTPVHISLTVFFIIICWSNGLSPSTAARLPPCEAQRESWERCRTMLPAVLFIGAGQRVQFLVGSQAYPARWSNFQAWWTIMYTSLHLLSERTAARVWQRL